jgi:hypothetical protein
MVYVCVFVLDFLHCNIVSSLNINLIVNGSPRVPRKHDSARLHTEDPAPIRKKEKRLVDLHLVDATHS